jgi:hypothetical protein
MRVYIGRKRSVLGNDGKIAFNEIYNVFVSVCFLSDGQIV